MTRFKVILILSTILVSFLSAEWRMYRNNGLQTSFCSGKGKITYPRIRWQKQLPSLVKSSPLGGDITGDFIDEVIIGAENGKIYILSSLDGSYIDSINTSGNIPSTSVLLNTDFDPSYEILFGSQPGDLFLYKYSCGIVWSLNIGHDIKNPIIASDINSDGMEEILFGADNIIFAINPDDGSIIWTYTYPDNKFKFQGPVTVFNDNGTPKGVSVIKRKNNTKVVCIDLSNGTFLWEYIHSAKTRAYPVVDTLNLLIIFLDDAGYMNLLDYDGTLVNSYFIVNNKFHSPPALADVDLDGNIEIIAGCDDSNIYVITEDGNIKWNYPVFGKIHTPPSLADIDNDDTLEIMAGAWDNYFYVFKNDDTLWRYLMTDVMEMNPALTFGDDYGLDIAAVDQSGFVIYFDSPYMTGIEDINVIFNGKNREDKNLIKIRIIGKFIKAELLKNRKTLKVSQENYFTYVDKDVRTSNNYYVKVKGFTGIQTFGPYKIEKNKTEFDIYYRDSKLFVANKGNKTDITLFSATGTKLGNLEIREGLNILNLKRNGIYFISSKNYKKKVFFIK